MFSCVRYCTSHYKHTVGVPVVKLNAVTWTYCIISKTDTCRVVGLLYSQSHCLLLKSDTISVDSEHDSCLQLYSQTVTCLNYLCRRFGEIMNVLYIPEVLEQNVVDRQRSHRLIPTLPDTAQCSIFGGTKSTRA